MQNFGDNNNGRFSRGGGGGRGGRGRNRGGGGRGRNNGGNNNNNNNINNNNQSGGSGGIKQICTYYIRGTCNQGDNCRFSHDISIATSITSLGAPVKAISISSEGSIFLAVDKSIHRYDPLNGGINYAGASDFGGKIQHIEVIDSYLFISCDSPLPQFPQCTVGLVSIFNTVNNEVYQLLRSESLPYTHPETCRTFLVEKFSNDIYIFTGGMEGMIHVWCFNPATSSVNHAFTLEGHIREVSCIALQGNFLWSGSVDCTINIWDLNTRMLVHTFRSNVNENFDNTSESGHSAPITCMTKISVGNDEYIATSSLDCQVIVWNNDQKYYELIEQELVVSMITSHDLSGEPILLLGLKNGNIVIRRWTNLDEYIVLDKPGLKHNGEVWSIKQLAPGIISTGGGDGLVNIWKIDKLLFNQ